MQLRLTGATSSHGMRFFRRRDAALVEYVDDGIVLSRERDRRGRVRGAGAIAAAEKFKIVPAGARGHVRGFLPQNMEPQKKVLSEATERTEKRIRIAHSAHVLRLSSLVSFVLIYAEDKAQALRRAFFARISLQRKVRKVRFSALLSAQH